jgi:hypothetical protein
MMYKYTLVLKATVVLEGIEYVAYPVIDRTTNTADKSIVEQAAVNRYIRENHGVLTNVEVVRTSVERLEEVA